MPVDKLGCDFGRLSGKDHYQVKWTDAQGTHYGIAEMYGGDKKEFNALASIGEINVADAVLPVAYNVQETDLTDLPHDYTGHYSVESNRFVGGGEYDSYVALQLLLHEIVDESIKTDIGVGRLFAVGVGDGNAYYVITKVNPKTCKIEWRGFQGDHYFDRMFGYGGSFRKQDLAIYCRAEKLFGKKVDRRAIYGECVRDFGNRFGFIPEDVVHLADQLGL